ncbi:MAG: DNA translocase FtsK 4TM domain-containing protein [Nitrospiraceae bacterium]|nr:DNA translocase FtsK 4TM domain-containing protein [Nitrospiraceae bacterium]
MHKKRELRGVAFILSALYIALSLSSYSRWDPSIFTESTYKLKNYGGIVGSWLADLLFSFFGVSAFFIPLFLGATGVRRIFYPDAQKRKAHLAGAALFIVSFSLLSGMTGLDFILTGWNSGGFIGQRGARLLVEYLSVPGGYILALFFFISSLILLSPVPIKEIISAAAGRKEAKSGGRREKEKTTSEDKKPAMEEDAYPEAGNVFIAGQQEEDGPSEAEAAADALPMAGAAHEEGGSSSAAYTLPPLNLLSEDGGTVERPTREELLAGSALLEKKLRDFGIQGKVSQVQAGPVVTMYEFEPAPGVKIQKVVALAEDLSLSLRAQSTRIAPIPGKAAIGIEVPNRQRETVLLRDIISSEGFRKSASCLTLALGKDIFGAPVVADLARMPHLLVAGATGAGKSVCLNSMITSILYKAAPAQVKMLMIDPKLLELSSYEGIPHLISPVITGPKAASEALKKMVFEMERRYRLIAARGARGIDGFNRTAPEEERLPYIVVVIDELADLMLSSASQVEDSIARLAQMARASGIHLILATQRPSVDVLTGVIKANFPTRIAFQVASRIDSRTILDAQGAEQLIGRGDMLLLAPGARVMRVHGAYIAETEIKAVSDFARAQKPPDYSIFEAIEEPAQEGSGAGTTERDELYEKAVDACATSGEVSISSIQRRLKIGFNRAARIVELMEEDELVGPPRGAGKPRAFLGRKQF